VPLGGIDGYAGGAYPTWCLATGARPTFSVVDDGMSTVEYANVELYTRRLTWVDTLLSAVRCMTSRPIFVPSADSGRGLSSYLEEA